MTVDDHPREQLALTLSEKLSVILATALGLGLSPLAPGTCGTLLGVLIHLFCAAALSPSTATRVLLVLCAIASLCHSFLVPWAQRYWRNEDPPAFVLDEVAGYLVVPVLFPHGEAWKTALLGFLLFRILDIVKLPPARQIDRDWNSPWAVLVDDLVSGVYAAGGLYMLRWLGV